MKKKTKPFHANTSLRNAISLVLRREHPRLLMTAVLASVSSAAFAQSQADADDAAARALEEIVVTASRRSQTLQDVPYNISAVSGDALQRANVADLSRLSSMVPGIAYTDQGDRGAGLTNNIIVRGLETGGAGDLGIGSSNADTVATYINETPMYANISIKDVQRVEFLRGPQGTLYGSGALGGALRGPDLLRVDDVVETELARVGAEVVGDLPAERARHHDVDGAAVGVLAVAAVAAVAGDHRELGAHGAVAIRECA